MKLNSLNGQSSLDRNRESFMRQNYGNSYNSY